MTDYHDDGDVGAMGPEPRRADVTYELDEDERPSEAVVRAVASLTDTSVLDLEPLYDAIDPDDLDGLFDGGDGRPASTSVTFRFGGCTVVVTPDEVHVRKADDDG